MEIIRSLITPSAGWITSNLILETTQVTWFSLWTRVVNLTSPASINILLIWVGFHQIFWFLNSMSKTISYEQVRTSFYLENWKKTCFQAHLNFKMVFCGTNQIHYRGLNPHSWKNFDHFVLKSLDHDFSWYICTFFMLVWTWKCACFLC